jgi:hypothetical protein
VTLVYVRVPTIGAMTYMRQRLRIAAQMWTLEIIPVGVVKWLFNIDGLHCDFNDDVSWHAGEKVARARWWIEKLHASVLFRCSVHTACCHVIRLSFIKSVKFSVWLRSSVPFLMTFGISNEFEEVPVNACYQAVQNYLSSCLLCTICENLNAQNYNFVFCFVWVWNFVCHIKWWTQAEGV